MASVIALLRWVGALLRNRYQFVIDPSGRK
jgi:hypothetical protein